MGIDRGAAALETRVGSLLGARWAPEGEGETVSDRGGRVPGWPVGVTGLLVVGGVLLLAGVGTWTRCWYAPLLRRLNGVHPRWLGPAYTGAGAGAVLAACASLAEEGPARGTLVIWAADALIIAIGCLVVGLRIRGRRTGRGIPG